ncbi:unnamed protein product, partial [Polarella glacialis]
VRLPRDLRCGRPGRRAGAVPHAGAVSQGWWQQVSWSARGDAALCDGGVSCEGRLQMESLERVFGLYCDVWRGRDEPCAAGGSPGGQRRPEVRAERDYDGLLVQHGGLPHGNPRLRVQHVERLAGLLRALRRWAATPVARHHGRGHRGWCSVHREDGGLPGVRDRALQRGAADPVRVERVEPVERLHRALQRAPGALAQDPTAGASRRRRLRGP